jgi:signal transduction histidine kinase
MRGQAELGAVLHDLRSGLSAGVAYLDLAREKLAEGEAVQADDLDRIGRALERVDRAIADLQALAQGTEAEA